MSGTKIPSGALLIDRAAERAVSTLLKMNEYQAATRISVYLSMETREIQTRSIVEQALGDGKTVFVPYMHEVKRVGAGKASSIMSMLALHSRDDYESLQPDKWGIPSLPKSSIDKRQNCLGGRGVTEIKAAQGEDVQGTGLDLIVVPGVAFDKKRDRLGHGKGYYDSFFSRYVQNTNGGNLPFLGIYCSSLQYFSADFVWIVGLALQEQILPDPQTVPTTSEDWRIDALATGSGELLR